jgi:hypothetical protein
MVVRVLTASAISAVLMFAWGFLFWGVSGASQTLLSPLPEKSLNDMLAVLRRDALPPGMYVYPPPASDMSDQAEADQFQQQHESGPLLQLVLKRGGPVMPPSCFVAGIALNFAYALLGATLLAMAASSLNTYSRRLYFALLYAVAGAIWTNLGDVIWWFHPIRYGLGNVLYQLGAGVLMALVIASLVKLPPPRES